MAANSFLEMTRSLKLYVPQLPTPLAEQMVRDRYRRILDRRDWSAMRMEAEFQLNAYKTNGTVTVTFGSATVTGSGTTFASTDVGRQFKAGFGSPIYTIIAVNVGGQTLTLDRPNGVTSQSGITYFIFDGYVIPPANFLRFIVVVDPQQGWRLRHWITAAELASWDPQRNFFGMPYVLADRLFNYATAGAAQPQPQFEAWPYTSTQRTLYYQYIIRPPDLINDADLPIWPLRSDAVVSGALADVVRWPGTPESPNIYYRAPQFWKSYDDEFEDKMIEIERRDEDIYVTAMQQWPYSSFMRFSPMSANWLQTHV